jgi:hypothetical protein
MVYKAESMSYILPSSMDFESHSDLKIKLSVALLEGLPLDTTETVKGESADLDWTPPVGKAVARSAKRTVKSSEEDGERHTEAKTYTCHIAGCEKTFADTGSLRKHTMTHGERQFTCPVQSCCKRFLDNSKLRRHMLVHTV